jgi:ATP-binding cassette subfamily B protein
MGLGEDLSGGEWQKIALARAYMRDCPVLILDEPTASLDAFAEYEVYKSFEEKSSGRLVVFISHRFSTVRMAKHILVLDNGELVEQGSHEALLARDGLYASMFNTQADRYR